MKRLTANGVHRRASLVDGACIAIATGLYLSYIPSWLSERTGLRRGRWTGAGIVGTLWGWALVYALPEGRWAYGACLGAAVAAACVVSDRAEKHFGVHDDSRIVIDETMGFWTAAWGLPRGSAVLLAVFVLFRVLDSVKLPPYRWLERLPGGIGVVMDDVGAGAVVNLTVRLALLMHPLR